MANDLHLPALLGEDGKPEHWLYREPKKPDEWTVRKSNTQLHERQAREEMDAEWAQIARAKQGIRVTWWLLFFVGAMLFAFAWHVFSVAHEVGVKVGVF